MATYNGKISEVSIVPCMTEAVQDHLAGETLLYVNDIQFFEETGGFLRVGEAEEILEYSAIDEENETVTLVAPLAEAVLEDAEVYAEPYGETMEATVDPEEGEDPVIVRVPQNLQFSLEDGVRDPSQRESCVYEDDGDETGGEFVLKEIVGEYPSFSPRTVIDLDIPGPPMEVPVISPDIEVFATSRSFIIQTAMVEGTTRVRYYISTDDTVPMTPENLIEESNSLVLYVDKLPGGENITRDVVYYFRAIAVNDVGVAAAPSSIVESTLSGITSDEIVTIVADKLVAGDLIGAFALLGGLQIGANISITTTDGIVINLSDGGIIKFPADGSPAQINGARAILDALTTLGELSIEGDTNFIQGTVRLASAIQPPAQAPTVSPFYWWVDGPTAGQVGGGTKTPYGMTQWNDDYAIVAFESSTIGQNSVLAWVNMDNGSVMNWDEGPATSYFPYWGFADVLQARNSGANGLLYLLHSGPDVTAANNYWYLSVIVPEPGGIILSKTAMHSRASVEGRPSLYQDPVTEKVYVVSQPSTGTYAGHLRFSEINAGGNGYVTSFYMKKADGTDFGPIATGGSFKAVGGTFDFTDGVNRVYVFPREGLLGQNLSFQYILNQSDYRVRATDEKFPMASQNTKGLLFRRHSTDAGKRLFRSITPDANRMHMYSKEKGIGNLSFKYSFYDSDVAGGTHESTPSPASPAVQPRRRYFKVNTAAPQDAGGVDDPNAIRIYANNILQTGGWFNTVNEAWFAEIQTSGSAPKTINEFETVLKNGSILSDKRDSSNNNIISLKGDGSGRVGPLSWDGNGSKPLPPHSKYVNSSAMSIPTTSWTTTTGWVVSEETPDNSKDAVSGYSNGVFTVREAGVYLITAVVTFSPNSTGRRVGGIRVNGSLVDQGEGAPGTAGTANTSCRVQYQATLAAGGTFSIEAYQSGVATLALNNAPQYNHMEVTKLF